MTAARNRFVSPGRRKRVSIKPSRSEAAFPLGDYMVPTTDALGRSSSIRLMIMPELVRAASILSAKGFYGFANEKDVFRWCVSNGIAELARRTKDKELNDVVNIVTSWQTAASTQMEFAWFALKFRAVRMVLDSLLKREHWGPAEALAEKVWQQVDRVDDVYWRGKFRKLAKAALDRVRRRGRVEGRG